MKVCFKCNIGKPLSDYYRHKAMADGHLNKCKECTKKDVGKHRSENLERIRAYDRNRPNKAERAAKQFIYSKTEKGRHVKFVSEKRYRESKPDRYKANTAVGNAIRDGRLIRPPNCEKCGIACKPHGHHDDYSKPLSVRWLCVGCHSEFHKFVREVFRNLEHTGLNNPFQGE